LPRADWSLFAKAPKPAFPHGYDQEVKDYQIHHGYLPGVLLRMTARKGTIVDIRVVDRKGPLGLCVYTVEWVRKNWEFRADITGAYTLPVYYELR
jgi:hypothetical protein